ncbi:MAG: JAB domain-containing protein [Clostridiales bacterium]
MRNRIEKNGLAGLEDHEILEYLLYFVHKRGDTNGIAHNLMATFQSLDKIFDADEKTLSKVKGVGPVTGQFLSTLPELFHRYERCRKEDGMRFVSLSAMVDWLSTIYYGTQGEKTVLLCLDADFNLIFEETWKEGSATQAMVSTRDIVSVCLKYNAAKVVFSHNHLTNISKPSLEDVLLTNELRNALTKMQIELIDHLIICPNGKYYSFKAEGRL